MKTDFIDAFCRLAPDLQQKAQQDLMDYGQAVIRTNADGTVTLIRPWEYAEADLTSWSPYR